MAHLAFLNFANQAHVAPVVPVVAELVRRGHRVTCVATERYAAPLEAAGAEVVTHESVLTDLVLSPDYGAAVVLRLFEENREILRSALKRLDGDRPDLIGYDLTAYQAGRILARAWQVPAAQFAPVFASNEHFSLSAKMIEAAPGVDAVHPALIEFAGALTGLLDEHGLGAVPLEEFIGRVEDTNVVFLPREFQVAGETFDDRFAFVGPCEPTETSGAGWRPAGSDPVLLATLGASYNADPGFFRTCIEAFAGRPWQLVLAIGNRIDPADLGELPANVEAHRWIPYRDVLTRASVFVCHAGMQGMLQAFEAGTPVVAVPQAGDNAINAERAAELGLGRVVRPDELTAETLRTAVREIAEDAGVRRRVQARGEAIRRAGGVPAAVDVLERRMGVPGRN